jgi:hypothetical protein
MQRWSHEKLVLTMIMIGIWALVLTQFGLPAVATRAEAEEAPAVLPATGPASASASQQRFWAELPLRWQVANIQDMVDADNATYCGSVITVRNLTDGAVEVEVEWFNLSNSPQAIRTRTIPAEQSMQFASSARINLLPFAPQNDASLAVNMNGYVNVHADDPRIMASAHVVCRDGTTTDSSLVAYVGIPASPVGATLDYFKAGLPVMGGDRPLADPEESR